LPVLLLLAAAMVASVVRDVGALSDSVKQRICKLGAASLYHPVIGKQSCFCLITLTLSAYSKDTFIVVVVAVRGDDF